MYDISDLPVTILDSSIIVINLDKHYMPGSYCVAICFSDSGFAEYFDSYGQPPYMLEMTTYFNVTQFLGHFNFTYYGV